MLLGRKISGKTARRLGMGVMIVVAIIGNLPMFLGTSAIAASTVSGTMVMGLGPIFCLHGMIKPTKVGFHLSFWGSLVIGVAFTILNTAGMWPELLSVGGGKSADMLGANLYGAISAGSTTLFLLLLLRQLKNRGTSNLFGRVFPKLKSPSTKSMEPADSRQPRRSTTIRTLPTPNILWANAAPKRRGFDL